MALQLITAPLEEPISLADAKLHLRETRDSQNAIITALIAVARRQVESITRRALITQTWDLHLDAFPAAGQAIEIPLSPPASVESITYVDADGVTQTWDAADYTVDTVTEPGRIVPAYNESYPSTRDVFNAVTVRFTAGYGAAADVPEGLKQAMRLLIGHLYLNRESVKIGQGYMLNIIPHGLDYLLADYRVFKFS
jgi:uncharacterized phiE125 gp8 family phage protein